MSAGLQRLGRSDNDHEAIRRFLQSDHFTDIDVIDFERQPLQRLDGDLGRKLDADIRGRLAHLLSGPRESRLPLSLSGGCNKC